MVTKRAFFCRLLYIDIFSYYHVIFLYLLLINGAFVIAGGFNQPKYGHLKELHDVLHSLEKVLTHGNISFTDFGNSVSVSTLCNKFINHN